MPSTGKYISVFISDIKNKDILTCPCLKKLRRKLKSNLNKVTNTNAHRKFNGKKKLYMNKCNSTELLSQIVDDTDRFHVKGGKMNENVSLL